MKVPNNPAAEAIDKLIEKNIELDNLKTQTDIANKEYCDRVAAEITSNQSIIDMLTPAAEWVEEEPTTI